MADLLLQAVQNRTSCGGSAIHGILLPATSAEIISPAIDEAVDSGIHIVTFLSDAPASKRAAFVGTNNTFFGEQLAKNLVKIEPNGGTHIIVTSPYDNMMERTRAFQAELGAEGGWSEMDQRPLMTEFDPFRSTQQVEVFEKMQALIEKKSNRFRCGGWYNHEFALLESMG